MKKLVVVLTLFIMSSAAQADGLYDGIWESPGLGYFSIHEKDNTVIVTRLSKDQTQWEAFSGTRIDNTVRISTLVGPANAVINVTLTSETTFSAVHESCVPLIEDYLCILPDDFTFEGVKVW